MNSVMVELFEHCSADRRLAGTDVAAEDDETFAAPDGLQQESDGFFVRGAGIEEARIGSERER